MRIAVFTWFFLVPLLAVLVCVDVALVSAQSQCQTDQQALLLQLKEELNFKQNKSERLVKWNSSTDCCNWAGVKCDNGGHVIGLNLSSESISGGIGNSSLFSLQYLQNLDLSFNNFNTTLPAMFGNLTELRYVNLSNAGFSGQIAIQISQLTRLASLDLSILYFPGIISLKLEKPSLATLIKNLTYLRELHLDGVNVSASGSEWCQALSSLPNLQVLSMSNCYLSGPFEPSLAQLQSLAIINLSKNNFSAPVPEFFRNFSNLTELLLSFCELLGTFPESIFQVPTLEILDLSFNKLLQGNFPDHHGSNALKTLLLSNTNFAGTLPMSIGNLQNLSRVELVSCKFVGSIPSTTENMSLLSYLDFSFNNFSGSLPSFHMARNLTHVDLSHNQLAGEISSTNWKALQSLVNVDLRYNRLNGSIPSSLFTIPSLQKILLSNNEFQGQVPDFQNASLSSLDTLDMSSNKLEGSLPQSLFQLQKLNVLSLSFNKFNGTIKLEGIQRLSNLTTLDLSYNNLTVEASANISASYAFPPIKKLRLASCNMKVFPDLSNNSKLFYLDLSDNQIGEVIPEWVWNGALQYLNVSKNQLVGMQGHPVSSPLLILDLSNNKLQGNIPLPPPTATYVDYSSNMFNYSIPPGIGDNPFIFFLSMSNNELIGGIPTSICNAGYLQVLNLSGNKLNGRIPSCLIDRSDTLGVLNLRDNNFSGKIPDQFPATCRLQTLDLSGNSLEGIVPKSMANCTMLEVLNIGSNRISDFFPCHIKEKTSLRVLVLRSNNFSGPIGCPKVNGTWGRLQIVDLASNSFSGKLPAKCLTTWKAMMDNEYDTYNQLGFKPLVLNRLYYEDSITVTTKGLQMELVKILTVFTSIDFSLNNLEGPIPDEIGRFTALYALNMSHNAFTGQIPLSLGNLSRLESLDLSKNHLSGQIPGQLAALTFLSFLNLSYNDLSGAIPTSTQLQSFPSSSFEGNEGLCGPPWSKTCNKNNTDQTKFQKNKKRGYDWEFIVPGIGFGLGAAMIMAPLMFSKKANKWCDDQIDKILLVLLPMFGLMYYTKIDWRRYPYGASEDNKSDNDDDDDIEDDKEEEEECQGRYCVFCTKLDITRTRVIHDTKCTCYYSPPFSAASSFYCTSSSSP